MKKYLILFSVVFLLSCMDVTQTVNFHGYVIDASTGDPIENAYICPSTAYLYDEEGCPGLTNIDGFYSFEMQIDCRYEILLGCLFPFGSDYITQYSPHDAVSCDNGRYDFYIQHK